MKVNRIIYSYAVKITDEDFVLNSGETLIQTARVTFRDFNKNIIEKKKYGVVDINQLYEKINKGDEINISNCYINNFSASSFFSMLVCSLLSYTSDSFNN